MTAPASPRILARTVRVSQWTKNVVVLAALLFAMGDRTQSLAAHSVRNAFLAFVAFCLAASTAYIINDLADAERDRQHPAKRLRPIAAGQVSVAFAVTLLLLTLTGALLLGWLVNPVFLGTVAGYLILQLLYTFWLKRVPLLDLFMIAFGFVIRAVAGALAIGVTISPWLLLCAFLLALFLALCKRRHERILLGDAADAHRPGLRTYEVRLVDQLIAMIGGTVIVCYAIYTLWPDTVRKFGTHWLGLTIPFVVFGIFRYLDLVYRHDQGGAPEKALLSDIPLLADLALYGLTLLAVFFLLRPGI